MVQSLVCIVAIRRGRIDGTVNRCILVSSPALQADHAADEVEIAAFVRPDHTAQRPAGVAHRGLRVVAVRIEDQDAKGGAEAAEFAARGSPSGIVDPEG